MEMEKEKLMMEIKSLNGENTQLKQVVSELQLTLSEMSPTANAKGTLRINYEENVSRLKEVIGHLEVCLEDVSLENIRLNTLLIVKEREIAELKPLGASSYNYGTGYDFEETKRLRVALLSTQEQLANLSSETNKLQVSLLREQQINKGLRSELEASSIALGQFKSQAERAMKEFSDLKPKGSQGERVKNKCMTNTQEATTKGDLSHNQLDQVNLNLYHSLFLLRPTHLLFGILRSLQFL